MIKNGIDNRKFKISTATEGDIAAILDWLRCEWNGQGFWGNRGLIEGGQATGDVSVLRGMKDDLLVGFLLSTDSSLDILEIRPEFRRAGLGRMLAEHGLRRIDQSEKFGVRIECAPSTSIPFWKTLGFDHIEWESEADRSNHLAYVFPRRCELPAAALVKRVRVELTTWVSCREFGPKEFVRSAAVIEEGTLLLEDRIAAFVDNGDALVKVQVGDETISEKKAKYSRDVGVEYENGFIRVDNVVA